MKTKEFGLKLKNEIKKEEVKLEAEIKKEEKGAIWFFKSHTFRIILTIIIFIVLTGGIIYLNIQNKRIYIDRSEINAPIITLSSESSGILEKIFVKQGQQVSEDMIVAQVNGDLIRTKENGLVILVQDTVGQVVNSQTPIVQMIDTQKLRVVGHIQEDKGLKDVQIGQNVIFTVDAFGSKQYQGIVESISPTSRQSDIVFSISDKRQEQEFDVKVKFDVNSYPELKNGMSAKMWIYK
jgi:multidrug resistance efflux pump